MTEGALEIRWYYVICMAYFCIWLLLSLKGLDVPRLLRVKNPYFKLFECDFSALKLLSH